MLKVIVKKFDARGGPGYSRQGTAGFYSDTDVTV